jgi:hypothetical protein
MKVGFGATQARRLLAAVEINDRIGADRPKAGHQTPTQKCPKSCHATLASPMTK